MGNKKETTAKDSQKENPAASNQHEDTYQPGQDWELAWSDEFKAGTIDANNWNSR